MALSKDMFHELISRIDIVIVLAAMFSNIRSATLRFKASTAWLVQPALCSNLKLNLAKKSCQQTYLGVNLYCVTKWLMAELYVFTMNFDPNK